MAQKGDRNQREHRPHLPRGDEMVRVGPFRARRMKENASIAWLHRAQCVRLRRRSSRSSGISGWIHRLASVIGVAYAMNELYISVGFCKNLPRDGFWTGKSICHRKIELYKPVRGLYNWSKIDPEGCFFFDNLREEVAVRRNAGIYLLLYMLAGCDAGFARWRCSAVGHLGMMSHRLQTRVRFITLVVLRRPGVFDLQLQGGALRRVEYSFLTAKGP
jgi:hypothetical protein